MVAWHRVARVAARAAILRHRRRRRYRIRFRFRPRRRRRRRRRTHCLQRLLHGRRVSYHRIYARYFDIFMSTSSMIGFFLDQSLFLSSSSAGDSTRPDNKINERIGFTLTRDMNGLMS